MSSDDRQQTNGPGNTGPEAAGEEMTQNTEVEARIAELQAQLDAARSEAADLLDKYRRNAADFSNFRKRQEREREQQARLLSMNVMRRLLPLVDDLDRALANAPADGTTVTTEMLAWIEGVRLIGRKLQALLESFGVKPIEAVGKPFDPYYHEATVRLESADHPEGTVLAEIQRGYLMDEEVLRPTQVAVSSKPAN